MILMRISFSCMAWPDGSIPHGHIDVRAQGTEDDRDGRIEVECIVLLQAHYLCDLDGKMANANVILLHADEDNDFDNGNIFAEVVGGEGDIALDYPVGTQFICP